MAIKVITVGRKPEDRQVQGTCTNCKTVCEWIASDGKHESCQRDGEWNTIACPTCGKLISGGYEP